MGVLRTTLINQIVLLGYFCGIQPERLYRFYYRKSSSLPGTDT
jgi:hypothetical protein